MILVTGIETFIHPSNVQDHKKQGRDMFEINVGAIVAFRENGRGLEAINSFS